MTSATAGELSARRRAMHAVGAVLALWALIVVLHHGEFWPFSIYRMFARAGQPWTNALVIEVDPARPRGERPWGPWSLDQLPGAVYPANTVGVSALDVAQMVKLTNDWTDERVGPLRKLFAPALSEGRSLMVVRADGRLNGGVEVELTGVVVLAPDGNEWRAAR